MQQLLFKMARLYGLSIVESEKIVSTYQQHNDPTFEVVKLFATYKTKPLRITIDIVSVAHAIQSLPKNERLVLIASTLGELSNVQIAEALQIPIDKVHSLKQHAKEKLLQITYYEELQQFLDQPEQVVIQNLGFPKKNKPKTGKKGQLYTVIGAVSVVILAIFIWQLGKPTEQVNETPAQIQDEETPAQSYEPAFYTVNTYDGSIPFPHEKTLNIAKAIYFYKMYTFNSQIHAERTVFNEYMSSFAKIDYLQRLGYFMPEERLEHYYERAKADYEVGKQTDATMPLFINKLNELFGYTEDDYIEYYLFVIEQMAFLNELGNSKDVFKVENEDYEKLYEEVFDPYYLSVGYKIDEYEEAYEQFIQMSNVDVREANVTLDLDDEEIIQYMNDTVFFYKKPSDEIILLHKDPYGTLNGGEAYLYELAFALGTEFNPLTYILLQQAIETTAISNDYLVAYKDEAKKMLQLLIQSFEHEMTPFELKVKTL